MKRWKSSRNGCLMSWPQIKKTVILKCRHLLLCATTTNNFSIRLWQWILYNWWPAQQLGGKQAPKLSPKLKLHQKKGHRHYLVVQSTTAFWIPAKPLHLRSMLSKLMRYTENCKACSGHWSTERTQFFSMTTPDLTSHNQCFRSWTSWATKFCHIHLTSHQPTTTSSSNSTIFCRENASTTSRMQKMLSKSLLNPEALIFMLQG